MHSPKNLSYKKKVLDDSLMEGSSYLTSPLNHTDAKVKNIMMKNRTKVLSHVEASLYE